MVMLGFKKTVNDEVNYEQQQNTVNNSPPNKLQQSWKYVQSYFRAEKQF